MTGIFNFMSPSKRKKLIEIRLKRKLLNGDILATNSFKVSKLCLDEVEAFILNQKAIIRNRRLSRSLIFEYSEHKIGQIEDDFVNELYTVYVKYKTKRRK